MTVQEHGTGPARRRAGDPRAAAGSAAREARLAPQAGGALPAQAMLLRSLQQTVGNWAVGRELQRLREASPAAGVLQRKVKIGSKPWMKPGVKLPAMPAAIAGGYQDYVVKQVEELAKSWRDDGIGDEARMFLNDDDFYSKLLDRVLTQGKTAAKSSGAPWARLKIEVGVDGNVTKMPWSSFNTTEGDSLKTELMRCPVQVSSNPSTTACHGNTHGKLPKKVVVPGGGKLADLPTSQQPDHTPYFEFLITGHKKDTGIERGILDRVSGLIYVTAHYEKGSFVWLSDAPAALVDDWKAKAAKYIRQLKG